MSDIKILRVLGHGDIIAKTTKSGSKLILQDPCVIQAVPEDESQQAPDLSVAGATINFKVMMHPLLMPYMRQDLPLELDLRQVVFSVEPTEQVIDKFNSLFSPIIMPKLNTSNLKL